MLVCPFSRCLKQFNETGNLKTHIRSHTGERPFQCTMCKMRFITKRHMQAHCMIHTGSKPFVCNFESCDKKYSRAGRLRVHQQSHVSSASVSQFLINHLADESHTKIKLGGSVKLLKCFKKPIFKLLLVRYLLADIIFNSFLFERLAIKFIVS